ncbi:MAG: hypothetical protein JXP34_02135, partial [Planctomycetes bacterium]|nr:hypothetical protein [Planctomycetota bacterium]
FGEAELEKGKNPLRIICQSPEAGLAASTSIDWIKLIGPKVKGAIEGESLRLIAVEGGEVTNQPMGDLLSAGDHRWIRLTKVKAFAKFALPVAEAGTYELLGRFVKSWDYGTFLVAIDGEPAGEPFNSYSPSVAGSELISFGKVTLARGDHTISFTMVGKDERSAGYFMGVDYIVLRPAR